MPLVALGERLRKERLRVGMDQRSMAEALGISRNSQQAYEAGRTPPPSDYLIAAHAKGVDIVFVLTGKHGDVVSAEETSDAETVEIEEIDLAYGLGGSFADGEVERQTHRFPQAWLRTITRTSPALLFFARGRGDSMTPTISDGDMVLIDRSQRSVREQDAMWALTVGQIAMIKRVRVHGSRVELLSDNERIPPYDAVQEELNIVGRVIFVGRRV